jgi:hypothetical protein
MYLWRRPSGWTFQIRVPSQLVSQFGGTKPTHRGCGVELGHGHKRYAVSIEQFDQLGKVGKRPCQTVDLVDYDDINSAGANVIQELL